MEIFITPEGDLFFVEVDSDKEWIPFCTRDRYRRSMDLYLKGLCDKAYKNGDINELWKILECHVTAFFETRYVFIQRFLEFRRIWFSSDQIRPLPNNITKVWKFTGQLTKSYTFRFKCKDVLVSFMCWQPIEYHHAENILCFMSIETDLLLYRGIVPNPMKRFAFLNDYESSIFTDSIVEDVKWDNGKLEIPYCLRIIWDGMVKYLPTPDLN